MLRIVRIVAHLLACTLLLAGATLAAQITGSQNPGTYVPVGVPSNIYTPEIHLGSATEPSTVTVPPVEEIPASPSSPFEPVYVSNAPPASTALLGTRHFDFIVAPEERPGSMEDTSISLGDYARELRAEKQKSSLPNAIGSPTNAPSNSPASPK
jgi:hypothetical protein